LRSMRSIDDVVSGQMCTGCGACAYVSPDEIRMIDTLDHGRRPVVSPKGDPRSIEALRVCPGIELCHDPTTIPSEVLAELLPAWGPVLELWEGFAADSELRFAASSGGAASALALYAIERGGMHGVLHITARRDVPYLNETVLSRSREELLAATGSRYAPASPCDSLDRIEVAPAPCVFIGKPCDVAATARARSLRPALDAKLGLTVAIFCAGAPSTRGTLDMLRKLGVTDPLRTESVRYRGLGWPGRARARFRGRDGKSEERSMSYEDSWGHLQAYRQWRCYVCADHTGEFADIAVGDPWYRAIGDDEPGRSLILVRSPRGREVLRKAVEAGYLRLERADSSTLAASQPELLRVRGAIWGRIWVSRLMGAAFPRYRGFPMFRFWWTALTLKARAQSLYGTVKRVFTKGLLKHLQVTPYLPDSARSESHPGQTDRLA